MKDIPAFPAEYYKDGVAKVPHTGMTLRDYFAAKYIQGLTANEHALNQCVNISREKGIKVVDVMAENAYGLADAMLKERDNGRS